ERAGSTGVRRELALGQRSGSRWSLRGWWSSFARLAARSCPRRAEARRSNRWPGRNGQGDLTAGPGRRARETPIGWQVERQVGTRLPTTPSGMRTGRRPTSFQRNAAELIAMQTPGGMFVDPVADSAKPPIAAD